MIRYLLVFLCTFSLNKNVNALLYPRETSTREIKNLNGIWNFRLSPIDQQDIGFNEKWSNKSFEMFDDGKTMAMPVPSSYNDITQSRMIRDYVGWVWYETKFYSYKHWSTNTIRLYIGSCHYYCMVFINGHNVVNNTGGHLPFDVVINKQLNMKANGEENLLVIALNNTLSELTIPQGELMNDFNQTLFPHNFYEMKLNFDFFNYAGIHRNVYLYILPSEHINYIDINTSAINNNKDGKLNYKIIKYLNNKDEKMFNCVIKIYDKFELNLIKQINFCEHNLIINNVQVWWPYTMSETNFAYLYVMKVYLIKLNQVIDEYKTKIGFRSIHLTNTSFLINQRPFYFLGFGKHEDTQIRGRGLDIPMIIKDFNLIKWIGANSFRTSHYPYSDELMDQADEQGIVVINECSAVGLNQFNEQLLNEHMLIMERLIKRDMHRPSVIMWSIANEPRSNKLSSDNYFKRLINFVKKLDQTRPITAALSAPYDKDHLGKYLDLIMINRYYAWYSNTGYTQVIKKQLINEFNQWYNLHNKLMILSEYGADTITGLHQSPSFVFTEDYQCEYIMCYHDALDIIREKGFLVGELIWNFADFMTQQDVNRVFGNRKGIFTRDRQPKASAKVIRCRYTEFNQLRIVDEKNMYCRRGNSHF